MRSKNYRPQVSIIILNWNAARDTLISINSCKAQSFQDIEIIVVDNGSTDDSKYILGEIDGIKLISAEHNTGFAGGVNAGLSTVDLAPGRMVLLLNNDAEMVPSALKKMVEQLANSSEVGILGGMVRDLDTKRVQFPGGGHLNYLSGSSRPSSSAPPDFISGAFMLIRSEVFASIGGLCEDYFMYWEDVDFSFRACRAGWKLGVAQDAIAYHKGMGSTGADSPVYDYYFTRSAIRFFWHGAGSRRVLPILTILIRKSLKRILFGPSRNLIDLKHAALDGFRGVSGARVSKITANRPPYV